MSRKYQPLPTMPCSRGKTPVRNVDCTEHVTAGSTVSIGRCAPSFASAQRFGDDSGERRSVVSPTTLMTTVLCMRGSRLAAGDGRLPAEHGVALPELLRVGGLRERA